jgi:hypothetical protein
VRQAAPATDGPVRARRFRQVVQRLRQRRHDRHLEDRARTVRVDRQRAEGLEEQRDLRLRRHRERRTGRRADVRQEGVRVLRDRAAGRRIGQVVAEQQRAVGQRAGADDRGRRRVGHRAVTLGELQDHRLRPVAGVRLLADRRGVGDRVAGLLHPLVALQHLLDRTGARHRVDRRRQVAQRDVLVEVVRHRQLCGRRQVQQLRLARRERQAGQHAERAESCDLGDRAARHVRHAGLHRTFDAEEDRAVDAAERLAGVVDAVRIEIGRAVAVDVDADLDLAHQLHQVRHRLAQAVTAGDDGQRTDRADAFGRVDLAVAVLVDAAPARGHDDRRAAGRQHVQHALRAAAMAGDADRDGGDAVVREGRRDGPRRAIHAVGEPMPEDRDRPAAGRARTARQEHFHDQVVDALRLRHPGHRAGDRDHLRGVGVVGRAELGERHARDRAGIDLQRRRRHEGRGERRCGAGLLLPLDALQPRDRKHGAHRAAVADHEVRARRRCGLDLGTDLQQVGADALGREHAERDGLLARRARGVPGIEQCLAVVGERAVLGLAEVQVVAETAEVAGLDRVAGGIAHAVGDDQQVARMLFEQLVGFDHQRLRGDVPLDLVDADLAARAGATECVAQVHEVDGVAVDRGDVDVAGERDRDARLGVEAVERVDHVDVGAVGHAHRAVRLRQRHALERVVREVGLREAVARERAGGRVGHVEADGDAGGQRQGGGQAQRDEHGGRP